MTREQLRANLGPGESAYWRAYDLVVGLDREDTRNALLRWTMMMIHAGDKAPGLVDLLPQPWAVTEDQLREGLRQRLGIMPEEDGADG